MKKKTDLHLHTNKSDGTWSNAQLIDQIIINNISRFSITDHDEIANSKEMSFTKLPESIEFIMGVELSTFRNGMRYHILAYQFDSNNKEIMEIIDHNKNATERWFAEIVKYACRQFNDTSYTDYIEYKNDSARGGHKAINYLVDRGFLSDASNFSTFAKECKFIPDYYKAEDIITAINNSGGFSFIAHPSEYRKNIRMSNDELKSWVNLGIDGIECYHPSASIEDSNSYVNFCLNNGLMISGGSDCHGTFLPERQIGKPEIYEDMINLKLLK